VILPGALPYILTGLRLGLAQAWRILVGIEMLAAVPWGLGWMIFGAREFLEHRRHAGRRGGDRHHRPGAGKTRVPEARRIHRDALGDDDVIAVSARTRSTLRATGTIVVAALLYEAVARTGYFPPALMPTLPKVWNALDRLAHGRHHDRACREHALPRAGRAWASPSLVGLPLGILMARWKPIENFFMPLVSALMPIPSLAWVPVFILWFGPRQHGGDPDRVLRRAVSDAAQHLVRRARGQSDLAPRRRRDGRQRARAVLEGDRAGRLAVHHHRIAAGVPARLDRGDRRGVPRRRPTSASAG
jgi:ABC-type proline/glycine betaine transport system permease subunit